MIITQHRNLSALNIALVTIVGTLLCLGIYLHLPEQLNPVLFEPALNNLIGIEFGQKLSPQANVLVALAFTLFQAFQLNRVVNYFNFLGKPNFMTALTFMTLVSLFIPFLVLSPTLICNFITTWMLGKLFNLYKHKDVKATMFDLGIIVAIGSLVYFPFIVMMILLWLSLSIFRPFYWREWLTPLLGFSTVYFLLAVIYYWTRQMDAFYQTFAPFTYGFPQSLQIDYMDLVVIVPIVIVLILFLGVLRTQYFKSIVHIRKSFRLLFYMILLVFASFYMNDAITVQHFLLCVPPLSIYLAYYFTHAKNKWIYESAYLLIVIGILYSQFS